MTSNWGLIGRLAKKAAWAPVSVVVLHFFLGSKFGHEPYLDPLTHFSGGIAIAFFFRYACSTWRRLLGAPNDGAIDLIAFGLAVTAAVFWEIGEFAVDSYIGSNMQRDLTNTMRDLILGTCGGGGYVLMARIARSSSTQATA